MFVSLMQQYASVYIDGGIIGIVLEIVYVIYHIIYNIVSHGH